MYICCLMLVSLGQGFQLQQESELSPIVYMQVFFGL